MNTSPVHIIGIGVLLAGSLLAQSPASPSAWQRLKFQQTVDPAFPPHLLQVGVNSGEARVVIDIDADGKLSECLVLGYTHEAFADAAVAAIRHWKFEPARLEGQPVGTIVELDFDFSVSGIVVSNPNICEATEALILRVRTDQFTYLPCAARELDRMPSLVVTLVPRYPTALAKRGVKGTVRVDFYIDRTGAVRLPSVSLAQNNELAALAIEAVRQWKFTPPTSRGLATLVKASEEFHFDGGS
jgi:TonB family protein